MTRVLCGVLASVFILGLAVSDVDAQRRKGRKKRGKDKTPNSEVIAKSMADLKWGMSKDDLMKVFTKKIKEKYRPLVAKAQDAMTEDNLRQQAREELQALRKSYIEFEGRKTGWDVSFLKGEFAHNNGESMFVMRDENSQNFYFFYRDRLWKWYKAFDASVFPAGDFDQFAGAVQRKFGKGRDVTGEVQPGGDQRRWIEWQDKTTRLRAIDQSAFYGFYCLVFEDKRVMGEIARERGPAKEGRGHHKLVDAVTSGGDAADPDEQPNIVDRITGKLRKVEQGPEAGGGQRRKRRGSSSSSSTPIVSSDDDPLRGL